MSPILNTVRAFALAGGLSLSMIVSVALAATPAAHDQEFAIASPSVLLSVSLSDDDDTRARGDSEETAKEGVDISDDDDEGDTVMAASN